MVRHIPLIHLIVQYHLTHLDSLPLATEVMVVDQNTNGVATAITGAATTITVPHNAPNTLYYYCTSHSGMGNDITGITTNEKLADPYAWKCILAVPGWC